ncbi:MAG: hypothetical protein R2774_08280 [Saprospiraceae bacterium]
MKHSSFLILGAIIAISVFISFKTIKHPQNLIWSDMEGYFVYLPSVFVYGDFGKEAVRDTNYIKPHPVSGKTYSKYTCGVAILELPFFLTAHLYSTISGNNQDMHAIYGRGNAIAGLFYFSLGLLILYHFVRRYYNKREVIIALFAIVLGTNLFYYTFYAPGMSHVYSFFLFSAFLLLTYDIFLPTNDVRRSTMFMWILYGLVFGMIVLVRPTNIIVGFIPIYIWWKKIVDPLPWIKANAWYLIIGALCFLLPFIPQVVYWKYVSGHYFLWSYGDESFKFWKEPKLFRVLFDAWNGWILYSPIVILPLYYLFKGRHTNQNFERIYLYIFAIATYIFASWWAWWFGGAFGHRSYVEYLAFLVLPLTSALQEARQNRLKYSILIMFIILCCYYSLGLTFLYSAPWDGENWTYKSVWDVVKKIFFVH